MYLKFLIAFASSLLFLVSSCTNQEKKFMEIPKEERKWMTQFFNNIMFAESGIYTLWGSKPLTLIDIPTFSDEEYQAFYNTLTEEEKNKGFYLVDYNLAKTWEKWEQISARFPMKKYKLFKTNLYHDDQCMFVFFVDILKTAMMIQDNYEAFHKVVGFDFHPLQVTLEIDYQDSIFWQKIKGHSYLWGLLFGYGKTNSYFFHWKHFDHPKTCDVFCKLLSPSFSNEELQGIVKFDINNFQIPDFMSFEDDDEVVERYNLEKMKIKKIYKEKDYLDLTLMKLMS